MYATAAVSETMIAAMWRLVTGGSIPSWRPDQLAILQPKLHP